MRHPHRVHRWHILARETGGGGRILYGCGYGGRWRGCVATYVYNARRAAAVDRRTMQAAIRIFGDMIAGMEQDRWTA